MSEWKADYIRLWEQYYSRQMSMTQVDDLMNRSQYQYEYIRAYKLAKLLEAVGKLRFPN